VRSFIPPISELSAHFSLLMSSAMFLLAADAHREQQRADLEVHDGRLGQACSRIIMSTSHHVEISRMHNP
jgi:hypothetical protein